MPVFNHFDICPDISEVTSATKAYISGKAPGGDGIPPDLLKLGTPQLTVEIHQVMSLHWQEVLSHRI